MNVNQSDREPARIGIVFVIFAVAAIVCTACRADDNADNSSPGLSPFTFERTLYPRRDGNTIHTSTSIRFTPDGSKLIAAGSRGIISIWETTTGQLLRELDARGDDPKKHAWIRCLALSGDGKRIASGDDQQMVRVWEIESGSQIASFGGNKLWLKDVALSHDGKQVAALTTWNLLRRWDIATGVEQQRWKVNNSGNAERGFRLLAPRIDRRGNLLVFAEHLNGGNQQGIVTVDVKPQTVRTLVKRTREGHLHALLISRDRRHLVTLDKKLRIWQLRTGEVLGTVEGRFDDDAHVALSRDGRLVAITRLDGIISRNFGMGVWDVNTGRELFSHREKSSIDALAFSPDGKRLVAASSDADTNFVRCWMIDKSKLAVADAKAANNPTKAITNAPRRVGIGKRAGETTEFKSLGLKLAWCPPGNFTMGSPVDEPGRKVDRETQVDVELTRGFWMGTHEITLAQWRDVMGRQPAVYEQGIEPAALDKLYKVDNKPVTCISYWDASKFCRHLTIRARKAGRIPPSWSFRLPTEAQWEYACRAGTTTATAFGKTLTTQQAHMRGQRPANDTLPAKRLDPETVGSFAPNAWGLYDMHGNVDEWCEDAYRPPLLGGRNPVVMKIYDDRVVRGGSYISWPDGCRSASRRPVDHQVVDYRIGLRIALAPIKQLMPSRPQSVVLGTLKIGDDVIPDAIIFTLGRRAPLSACFDPRTLTYRAIWQGGFIKRDAETGTYRPDGKLMLTHPGTWAGLNNDPTKPLPDARYHGHYKVASRSMYQADKLAFAYRLGEVEMIEVPALISSGNGVVQLGRRLRIRGEAKREWKLPILEAPQGVFVGGGVGLNFGAYRVGQLWYSEKGVPSETKRSWLASISPPDKAAQIVRHNDHRIELLIKGKIDQELSLYTWAGTGKGWGRAQGHIPAIAPIDRTFSKLPELNPWRGNQ